MSKAGTKRAITTEPAKPITKRRIALAACCGAALLAAFATIPARDGTTAWQVAALKPAPVMDGLIEVRREDITGSISKKKKSGKTKTKYMKAAEEPNAFGDWFKKVFSDDDKTARKRTSAID